MARLETIEYEINDIFVDEMLLFLIGIFAWVLLLNNSICLGDDSTHCRDRERLIEDARNALYELVDVTLGQKCTLQCNYCHEKDDERPKIWYKVDNFATSPHEVALDMNNNASRNKIAENKEHNLIINNFQINNTGLYYCKRLEEELEDEQFNYLVDLVFEENVTSFETGNLTAWQKYSEEYFLPINTLFRESRGVEFKRIREELKIDMELITQWKSWGICEVCGRPQDKGIKKRTGYCRIKLFHTDKNSTNQSFSDPDLIFLKNNFAVSCRSQVLGRILPGISNLTRIIPNFLQHQPCQGTCNPDAEGLGRGWKTGKTAAYKYRKTVVLAENSHLTLICPESTLDSIVVWKKNGKVLKAGESVVPPNPEEEPRITVDTFNTLYLVNVKESEEGNYTCFVDDTRMQQIIVYVVSKARLLTRAFVRHMMYLGFVLSLTLPCYCAGLVIACSKRRVFKGYEELKEIDLEKQKNPYHRL